METLKGANRMDHDPDLRPDLDSPILPKEEATMKCPECGDWRWIEDNGADRNTEDFTYLCLAPDNESDDGECGHQWQPNEEL